MIVMDKIITASGRNSKIKWWRKFYTLNFVRKHLWYKYIFKLEDSSLPSSSLTRAWNERKCESIILVFFKFHQLHHHRCRFLCVHANFPRLNQGKKITRRQIYFGIFHISFPFFTSFLYPHWFIIQFFNPSRDFKV